jgi:hypothetical protein
MQAVVDQCLRAYKSLVSPEANGSTPPSYTYEEASIKFQQLVQMHLVFARKSAKDRMHLTRCWTALQRAADLTEEASVMFQQPTWCPQALKEVCSMKALVEAPQCNCFCATMAFARHTGHFLFVVGPFQPCPTIMLPSMMHAIIAGCRCDLSTFPCRR